MKKTIFTLLTIVAVFCCTAPAAQANSSSKTVHFNSSVKLTGNVWIQSISDWDSCGNYATSVVSNRVLDSVTNKTVAEPYGIGASAWRLSISGPSGSTSTTWTNSGSRGSYLSGNVCASWNTLYLSMTVSGTGNYNGVVRTVAAQV